MQYIINNIQEWREDFVHKVLDQVFSFFLLVTTLRHRSHFFRHEHFNFVRCSNQLLAQNVTTFNLCNLIKSRHVKLNAIDNTKLNKQQHTTSWSSHVVNQFLISCSYHLHGHHQIRVVDLNYRKRFSTITLNISFPYWHDAHKSFHLSHKLLNG